MRRVLNTRTGPGSHPAGQSHKPSFPRRYKARYRTGTIDDRGEGSDKWDRAEGRTMGMTPVDMSAVDRMGDETAAQSEEGAERIGDAVRQTPPPRRATQQASDREP